MEQQPLVVLGAGFGGLRAALLLERGLRQNKLAELYQVVLVDQNRYHTYTPLLTETATMPEETYRERKAAAGFDIQDAIRGTDILFVNDRVTDVDPAKRMVALLHHPPILYSSLVVALGGETNYFNIPGIEEHAMPLKTLAHAQLLAMRLHEAIAEGADMRIVVGGGGPTGVELAGSLAALRDDLVKKHPTTSMTVTIVEGQPSILPGFAPSTIQRATAMLRQQDIRLMTGLRIARADAKAITLENGTTIPYDVFVWTGGIKASHLVDQLSAQIDHGRLAVDGTMACLRQTPDLALEDDLYAIGDIVCFHDPRTGAAVPWVAVAALEQADAVARNIVERLKAKHVPGYIPRLRTFRPRTYEYIIPIGRKDAVARMGSLTLTGFFARFLKWLVELRYISSLLPFRHALQIWWKARKLTV